MKRHEYILVLLYSVLRTSVQKGLIRYLLRLSNGTYYNLRAWWRNGSAFDSRSKGCVFKSRPGHILDIFFFNLFFIFFWGVCFILFAPLLRREFIYVHTKKKLTYPCLEILRIGNAVYVVLYCTVQYM